MNAIRRDEVTDNIHSMFVDQWDWEKIITREERNEATLKRTVKRIYDALRHTEQYIVNEYDFIGSLLPEKITFLTAARLRRLDAQRRYHCLLSRAGYRTGTVLHGHPRG